MSNATNGVIPENHLPIDADSSITLPQPSQEIEEFWREAFLKPQGQNLSVVNALPNAEYGQTSSSLDFRSLPNPTNLNLETPPKPTNLNLETPPKPTNLDLETPPKPTNGIKENKSWLNVSSEESKTIQANSEKPESRQTIPMDKRPNEKNITPMSVSELISSMVDVPVQIPNHAPKIPTSHAEPVTPANQLVDISQQLLENVSRILTSTPDALNPEVRIMVNQELMPGTDIILTRSPGGILEVTVTTIDPSAFQTLVGAQDKLKEALKKSGPVNVTIKNRSKKDREKSLEKISDT
ncbi:MAG: hypothetical protein LBT86_10210 [Deltaproteobacteria bacterium]|jgi:hypothetical protein|nr:hypothetical protein [Deltaproteobacteria bacterium]